MRKILLFCLLATFSLGLVACGGGGEETTDNTGQKDTLDLNTPTDAEMDKAIESFPSPMQLADLMKRAGAHYNGKLMNPENKTSQYQSTFTKATNLGVYSADMAYANTFEQRQQALRYFSAVRTLAEELMLDGIFTRELERRLKDNQDKQKELSKIYSETLSKVKDQLREDGDPKALNYMFLGGFIEGLYLATQLYEQRPSQKMMKQIAEQKPNMKKIMKFLDKQKDEPEFKSLYPTLKELDTSYDKVKFDYKSPDEKDKPKENKGVIQIGGSNDIGITPDDVKAISTHVGTLRKGITQQATSNQI